MNTLTEEIEHIDEQLFFVAGTAAMRKLRTQIELLAKVNVPVLITGERGSGKEVAARLIHKLSLRSGNSFGVVNCAALSGDMLDSELFGWEPGTVLNLTVPRPGKFEFCNKGTLLLDEVSDIPAPVQTKLFHVLKDQRCFRLGGSTSIDLDVRIIAATSMNVDQLLSAKRLREDLYYQFSAFTLHIPPLRERREEIPLLFNQFMSQLARSYGLLPRVPPPVLLDECQHYPWPGNLRELENVVKRYLVMGDEFLEIGNIATKSETAADEAPWTASIEEPSTEDSNGDAENLKALLRTVKGETERSAIATKLEKTHWNRRAAARELGISYRGLLYKIQQYQLLPPPIDPAQYSKAAGSKRNGQER